MGTISKRLQLLRNEMQQHKIDIYLVPTTDAHNSEYVPECWQRRPWISNFDGSAGEVVVTLDSAYLWTDGRYFLQAEQQLDVSAYTLMKQSGFVPGLEEWLTQNGHGLTLGVDPQLISISRLLRLQELMQNLKGKVEILENNLIDNCKKQLGESLALPKSMAFAQIEKYSGSSLSTRLTNLATELVHKKVDFLALNVLDEIAWAFNIRGSDVSYNPLVISYAIIGQKESWLFVDSDKIPHELKNTLHEANVTILDYSQFGEHLAKSHGTIWLDDKTANYWMLDKASATAEVVFAKSPIVDAKSIKNKTELSGTKAAHIKDAVAVISFLCWLDSNWQTGVTETSCEEKLLYFRQQQENLRGDSFATISGFAHHGAIIHYHATPETNITVDDSNMYLLDSGGQYLEGTTDITRTVHLGTPNAIQKHHYTLVLQGHLSLGRAVFPHGTYGEHLDILARAPLWNEYLNYRHGTGHGVGSFLCVHEGPQKISQAISGTTLLPGMILSNEPGLYIDGMHGIRIENLVTVCENSSPAAMNSEYGPFYQFENLTLVPYCRKLIDLDQLSVADKAQIKEYYAQIRAQVRPLLGTHEQQWLDRELDLFI